MPLPKSITAVTPLSKTLAVFIFILLPFIGFYLGIQYEKSQNVSSAPITIPTPAPVEDDTVFCTMDAKACPDGSYVGRIPPNCEFAPCQIATIEPITCPFGVKICPDGTTAKRIPPSCQFALCPTQSPNSIIKSKTYTSQYNYFSFTYPGNWKISGYDSTNEPNFLSLYLNNHSTGAQIWFINAPPGHGCGMGAIKTIHKKTFYIGTQSTQAIDDCWNYNYGIPTVNEKGKEVYIDITLGKNNNTTEINEILKSIMRLNIKQ